MLSRSLIKTLSERNQTPETNIVREYCQHMTLSYLYQHKRTDGLLFKGGTCLRILHNSPRFSEDLDFTGLGLTYRDLKLIFQSVRRRLMETGLQVTVMDEKATSGGYLGIFRHEYLDFDENIKVECSLRKRYKETKAELYTVTSDYCPSFTVLSMQAALLVHEKISALLERNKARDYYDIYFILRSNIIREKTSLDLGKIYQRLVNSKINFKRELKPYLPKTHHNILNDFKGILLRELRSSGFG